MDRSGQNCARTPKDAEAVTSLPQKLSDQERRSTLSQTSREVMTEDSPHAKSTEDYLANISSDPEKTERISHR